MLKFLIKISLLTALVVGIVLLLQHLGPLTPDTRVTLKYIGLGALAVAGLGIISLTVIVLAGIALAAFVVRAGTGERGWKGFESLKGLSALSALSGLKGLGDVSKYHSRTVELSVPKYGFPSFKVKTLTGDLELAGHAEEGARATVEILERSEGDAEVLFEDGELKVRCASGGKAAIGDAKIFLPAKLDSLSAESVNGDISITGFKAGSRAAFKGVNGDISVSGLDSAGEALVKTVSGDVEIKDSRFGSLSAQTISGDLEIKDSSAAGATLKTVSGDIDYSGCDLKDLSVKTVSGKVTR